MPRSTSAISMRSGPSFTMTLPRLDGFDAVSIPSVTGISAAASTAGANPRAFDKSKLKDRRGEYELEVVSWRRARRAGRPRTVARREGWRVGRKPPAGDRAADRYPRVEIERVGEPAADRMDSQGGGVHHADDAVRERQNARRVDVVAQQLVHERVRVLGVMQRRLLAPRSDGNCCVQSAKNRALRGRRHA